MNLPGYDEWKLRTPYDDEVTVGDEEGQPCGRYPEPDGDEPRGWKPKSCRGVMHYAQVEGCSCHIAPPCNRCVNNPLVCDTCGDIAA